MGIWWRYSNFSRSSSSDDRNAVVSTLHPAMAAIVHYNKWQGPKPGIDLSEGPDRLRYVDHVVGDSFRIPDFDTLLESIL